MKVYLPPNNLSEVAGANTFLSNLIDYINTTDVDIVDDPRDSDVILINIQGDKNLIDIASSYNIPIVQRLDGVFYPEKHKDYLERNLPIVDIYKNIATKVIFQSIYSKNQCFEMLGEIPRNKYEVIINGVNPTIFYKSSKKNIKIKKIRFVTTARFRKREMIAPIVKALDLLKKSIDFELVVAGPIVNDERKIYFDMDDIKRNGVTHLKQIDPIIEFFDREYIKFAGSLGSSEVANLLRESDIFLYSHLNPPCPNSVVEAVACGLPVVGFNSGSMEELLFFAKDLLANVSKKLIHVESDLDEHKLLKKIKLCVDNFDQYKKISNENASIYNFENCGSNYLKIFRESIQLKK